jgi:proteasome alpha subunit
MEAFQNAGYDRSTVTYSPDGRIMQMEYARKAVSRGPTIIGLKALDGIVLVAVKTKPSKLMISTKKIHGVDEGIKIVGTGLVGDANLVIEQSKTLANNNRVTYDEPIDIYKLSKELGKGVHTYTTSGGYRPLGMSVIIGGKDETGYRLYGIDVSGTVLEYKAITYGVDKETITEILEEKYEDSMTVKDIIDFLDSLKEDHIIMEIEVIK